MHKPRTPLDDAIRELIDSSRECSNSKCRLRFVYGREGSIFCSEKCARQVAQRRYRKNVRESNKKGLLNAP